MKLMILACLLMSFSSPVLAQTTAEEYYDQASVKMLESYGKAERPAVIDAAIAGFDRAIQLKADYHDAYNFRANMKLEKGDLDGALSDYSKAIEFSSTTASYYTNRASVRAKMKDLKGSFADYDKALALRPINEHAYLERGEIRLNNKDYAGALVDFNKALELKPGFFAVRRRRAEAYRALGENKLADADEKIYKEEGDKFMEKLFGK